VKMRTLIAMLALCGTTAAGAATQTTDYGSFSVSYDNSTIFGAPSLSFSSSGGVAGFGWIVPNSVSLVSLGGNEVAVFDLPSFTITANNGFTLSGLNASFGNLSYVEFGDVTTNVVASAMVSLNGGPAAAFGGNVAKVSTLSSPNFNQGYFGDSSSLPGSFTSLSISHASLTLSSSGLGMSSIAAQPQNELKFSLIAAAVPEPESYAMLLAGLGLIGAVARRGKRQA